jgi:phosphoribosylglycinamide formyltransferase-1
VSPPPRRLGVLISGRGSNLQALIEAAAAGTLGAEIALVVSNVAGAAGLERARAASLPAHVCEHRGLPRAEHEARVLEILRAGGVNLVALAGYMRLLSGAFVHAVPGPVLNVHPSLLPAFPGVSAQEQALAHGVKVSGATVHLVVEELDAGPIVLQEAVPVREDDSVESLAARILEAEHRIFPRAVRIVASGRYRLEGRRVILEETA